MYLAYRGTHLVDLQLVVTYATNRQIEKGESPHIPKQKSFNCRLKLDGKPKIVDGYDYRNNSRIDIL